MRYSRKSFLMFSPLFILLFLMGCSTKVSVVRQLDIPFYVLPVEYMVSDDFSTDAPATVAVLPFRLKKSSLNEDNKIIPDNKITENPSVRDIGIKTLRKVFSQYFSTLSYQDVEPTNIDSMLHENEIKTVSQLYNTDPSILGRILNVDAVIMGEMESVSNFTGGLFSQTVLSGSLKMVSTKNNTILWSTEHCESTEGGLIIHSGQILDAIDSQIENAKKDMAFVKVAEEFSRKVVNSIPDEKQNISEYMTPPTIKKVSIENTDINSKILIPSDKITIKMEGDSGAQACFDIGLWKTSVPMKEIKQGAYEGSYRVEFGDSVSAQPIACRLKNRMGIESVKFLDNITFTCRGEVLPQPTDVTAKIDGGTVKLHWSAPTDYVDSYMLYRSKDTPHLSLVKIVQTNSFEDHIDSDTVTLEYQIIASDKIGNLSIPSDILQVSIKPPEKKDQ